MEIKKSLPGLKPGYRYYLQARSVSDSGYSEWSEVFTFDIDALRPAPLPVQSLTAEFDGSTLVIEWDDTNPKLSEDFLDFQIKLTSGVTSVTYYTSSSRFEFSVEANEQAFGIIKSTISIEVRSRNTSGSLSSAATTAASNAAPSTPGGSFNVVGIAQGYTFDFSQITGKPSDYLTTRIFIYENLTGGSPIETVDTTEESFTYITGDYLKRYVTIAYVDIFGGVGGQVSPRQEVQATSPIVIDTSQPILASGSLVAGESIDITGFEIASNVITITATAHGLVTGDDVIISGISRDIDGLYENLTKINDNSFSVTGSNLTNTAGQVTVEAVATKASGKRVVITNDGIAGYIDEGVSFELVNDPSGVNKIGGWKFDDVSIKNAVPVPGLPDRNIELRSDQVSLMTNALIVKNVTQRERSGNTATITLDSTHYFAPGDEVNVENVESSFNGIVDITAVTDTTFSYANLGADVSTTASTGTVSTYYGSGITGACTATCPVIWAGSNDVVEGDLWSERPNAKFIVRNNGFMKATDADITGNINALSGVIGGWTIGDNALYSSYTGIASFLGIVEQIEIDNIGNTFVFIKVLRTNQQLNIGGYVSYSSNGTTYQSYIDSIYTSGGGYTYAYVISGTIPKLEIESTFSVADGYFGLIDEGTGAAFFSGATDEEGSNYFVKISNSGLQFGNGFRLSSYGDGAKVNSIDLFEIKVSDEFDFNPNSFIMSRQGVALEREFGDIELRISSGYNDTPSILLKPQVGGMEIKNSLLLSNEDISFFPGGVIPTKHLLYGNGIIIDSYSIKYQQNDNWVNISAYTSNDNAILKFQNLFQNLSGYINCSFKIFPDGMVRLRGVAQTTWSGGIPAGSTILILPEGCRPSGKMLFPTIKFGGVTSFLTVDTDGKVAVGQTLSQNDFVSLSSIQFHVD